MLKFLKKTVDWKDLAERAEWTFAQAFVATIGVGATGTVNVATYKAAAVAGVAAVLSMLKTWVVSKAPAKE